MVRYARLIAVGLFFIFRLLGVIFIVVIGSDNITVCTHIRYRHGSTNGCSQADGQSQEYEQSG